MRRNPFWTPYLKITRIWRPLIEINKAWMKPSVDSFKLVFIAFECKRFPAVSGNLSTSIRRVLKTSFVFSAFFALASKRVLVFFTQKNTLQDGETIKLRVFMRTTKKKCTRAINALGLMIAAADRDFLFDNVFAVLGEHLDLHLHLYVIRQSSGPSATSVFFHSFSSLLFN